MSNQVRIERVQFNHPTMVLDTGVPSDYLTNGQKLSTEFRVRVRFDKDDRFICVTLDPCTEQAKKNPKLAMKQLISLSNCRAILLAPEGAVSV